MSSHHFVKEGQEPALIIADPLQPVVEALLEWAPLVIVLEAALDQVLLWGIKIDAAVVPADNSSVVAQKLADQMPVKIIPCSASGPLETALAFAQTCQQPNVHLVAAQAEPYMESVVKFAGLDITVINANEKWYRVTTGHLRKWLPAGRQLGIRAAQPVSVEGALLEPGNIIHASQNGLITLQSAGPFWVSESL